MTINLTNYFLTGEKVSQEAMNTKAFKRALEKTESVMKKLSEQPIQPVKQAELFPKPWSDKYAIGANTIVRSAIFGTYDRQAVYNKRDNVYSYEKSVELAVQGDALNQTDYDVFQLLLIASADCGIKAGTKFQFTRYAFLKELGWPINSATYARLDEALHRLATFNITMKISPNGQYKRGFVFVGSLIQLARDATEPVDGAKTSHVRVSMHEELANFFKAGVYHLENLEQRKNLGKNQLAKGLHAFYSSHMNPLPIHLNALQQLVGDEQLTKHFKQQLKTALAALQRVGFIESWKIFMHGTGEALHVVRSFTNDEKKHLKESKATSSGNPAYQVIDELKNNIDSFYQAASTSIIRAEKRRKLIK